MDYRKAKDRFNRGKRSLVLGILLVTSMCLAEESPWLLGDWGGKRTSLSEEGIDFEFVTTLEGVQNISGGVANSSRGLANFDLVMDAQGQALGFPETGDLHVYFLGNAGGTPSEMIGDVQVTSNIEAPSTLKLYELYWRQRFADDDIAFLIGLHDYNALFDVLETAGLFMNSSFGISPDISQVPPSIFPTTSLAAIGSIFPTANTYVYAGVYDGDPGDPDKPYGTQIILQRDDGLFYALEGGYQNEETGTKLGAGAWYRTTDFVASTNGRMYKDNVGVYAIGEASLAENWAAFFQVGNADKHRNEVGLYVGAGVTRSAVWTEDDTIGIGMALAFSSDEYDKFDPEVEEYEMAVELTYELPITEWFTLQPDIQWIKNPGMDPSINDALALGLRAYIAF